MNPSSPSETATSWEEQCHGFHSRQCTWNREQYVMRTIVWCQPWQVTFPPASLVYAVPSPTTAVMMCWKDSFLHLDAGTGRRKTLGGRWAHSWCKWAGTAVSSILTSTPWCSMTTHFAEVIFHCRADACTIQRQILTLVSFRAAWICNYGEPEMTSRKPIKGDASCCLPFLPLRHVCTLIISHLLPFEEKRCLLRRLALKPAGYGKNTLPMLSAPQIVWIGFYVMASTA